MSEIAPVILGMDIEGIVTHNTYKYLVIKSGNIH